MKYLIGIILVIGLSSCYRLDDNLYNNSVVEEYKWDNYEGAVDFKLNTSYNIPLNLMNEVVLDSKSSAESVATKIFGLYIGNVSNISTDTVILYCHGNRDHMDFYWPRAKLLANSGGKNRFGVMMIDYRGFGKSRGEPSEEGMYADVKAAINWLGSNGLSSDRLVIYGFSMGSAPAVYHSSKSLSANLNPSKLILENPFASADAMVQDAAVISIPGEFVVDLELDNAQAIQSVIQPLQIWMSEDDKFLRKESHGEVIYKNHAGAVKSQIIVPEADHSTLVNYYFSWKYAEKIAEFISQ